MTETRNDVPSGWSTAGVPLRRAGQIPTLTACRDLASGLAGAVRADRWLRLTCLAIMAATLALIGIALAMDTIDYLRGIANGGPPSLLDLSTDNSVPERLMQGCATLTAVTLAWCGWRHRIFACLGLAGIYLFIVLDDALSYHERVGTWLAEALSLAPTLGMRGQDLGEILAWAIAGTVLVVPPALAWVRGVPIDRAVLSLFGLCLAALVVAGGGVDMLHVIVTIRGIGGLLGIVEDGGEMIAVAASACLALALARGLTKRGVHAPPPSPVPHRDATRGAAPVLGVSKSRD